MAEAHTPQSKTKATDDCLASLFANFRGEYYVLSAKLAISYIRNHCDSISPDKYSKLIFSAKSIQEVCDTLAEEGIHNLLDFVFTAEGFKLTLSDGIAQIDKYIQSIKRYTNILSNTLEKLTDDPENKQFYKCEIIQIKLRTEELIKNVPYIMDMVTLTSNDDIEKSIKTLGQFCSDARLLKTFLTNIDNRTQKPRPGELTTQLGNLMSLCVSLCTSIDLVYEVISHAIRKKSISNNYFIHNEIISLLCVASVNLLPICSPYCVAFEGRNLLQYKIKNPVAPNREEVCINIFGIEKLNKQEELIFKAVLKMYKAYSRSRDLFQNHTNTEYPSEVVLSCDNENRIAVPIIYNEEDEMCEYGDERVMKRFFDVFESGSETTSDSNPAQTETVQEEYELDKTDGKKEFVRTDDELPTLEPTVEYEPSENGGKAPMKKPQSEGATHNPPPSYTPDLSTASESDVESNQDVTEFPPSTTTTEGDAQQPSQRENNINDKEPDQGK